MASSGEYYEEGEEVISGDKVTPLKRKGELEEREALWEWLQVASKVCYGKKDSFNWRLSLGKPLARGKEVNC